MDGWTVTLALLVVSDQKSRVYYVDSATRPNTFWVPLGKLDLRPGAAARKLTIEHGEVFSGDVSDRFLPAGTARLIASVRGSLHGRWCPKGGCVRD